jgi:hypothetical protein
MRTSDLKISCTLEELIKMQLKLVNLLDFILCGCRQDCRYFGGKSCLHPQVKVCRVSVFLCTYKSSFWINLGRKVEVGAPYKLLQTAGRERLPTHPPYTIWPCRLRQHVLPKCQQTLPTSTQCKHPKAELTSTVNHHESLESVIRCSVTKLYTNAIYIYADGQNWALNKCKWIKNYN